MSCTPFRFIKRFSSAGGLQRFASGGKKAGGGEASEATVAGEVKGTLDVVRHGRQTKLRAALVNPWHLVTRGDDGGDRRPNARVPDLRRLRLRAAHTRLARRGGEGSGLAAGAA